MRKRVPALRRIPVEFRSAPPSHATGIFSGTGKPLSQALRPVVGEIVGVTAEDFVSAVSGQNYGDELPRLLGDCQHVDRGGIGQRFAHGCDQAQQIAAEVTGDFEFVMNGVVSPRHRRGKATFVHGQIVGGDGESLYPFRQPRRGRRDQTGIDSTGKQNAYRDIRHQPAAYRAFERMLNSLQPLLVAGALFGMKKIRAPIDKSFLCPCAPRLKAWPGGSFSTPSKMLRGPGIYMSQSN